MKPYLELIVYSLIMLAGFIVGSIILGKLKVENGRRNNNNWGRR